MLGLPSDTNESWVNDKTIHVQKKTSIVFPISAMVNATQPQITKPIITALQKLFFFSKHFHPQPKDFLSIEFQSTAYFAECEKRFWVFFIKNTFFFLQEKRKEG